MRPGAYRISTIRAAEKASPDLASGVLMQRAATAVATETMAVLRAGGGSYGRVVVGAIGPGHNGADGLYAAAQLASRGVNMFLWLTEGRAHEAALWAARRAGAKIVEAADVPALLPRASLVLDAVYGIGGRAGLPQTVETFARACADLDVPVISVDVPSGLDADEGLCPKPHFRAQLTVTFGVKRFCHVQQPARTECGTVVVADIGLEAPSPDLREFTITELISQIPVPTASDDKYSRGVVGIDAGSNAYIGAGVLAATGAVYTGAGMVRFVGPKAGPVRIELPNVVAGAGRVQSWLLGSGWGGFDGTEVIRTALADGVPVILDADALVPECLPQVLRPNVVLTPHAGELARMLGRPRADIEAHPIRFTEDAVAQWGATVLLKGATQYVASPGFPTTVAIPGPAWTAQAGSGDVLAGMCATFVAAGVPGPQAALCAASLQALAAGRCQGPQPPQDVARMVPQVISDLLEAKYPRM